MKPEELLSNHTIALMGGKGSGKTTFLVLEGLKQAINNKTILIDCAGIISTEKLALVGIKTKIRLIPITAKNLLSLENKKNLKRFLKFIYKGVNTLTILRLELTSKESADFFNIVSPYFLKVGNLNLLIDESQEVLPQNTLATYSSELERLIRIGRNYHVRVFLASHRPQYVNKRVLGLVDTFYFGRLTYMNDIKVLADIIGLSGAETIRKFTRSIKALKTGVFYHIENDKISVEKYNLEFGDIEEFKGKVAEWQKQLGLEGVEVD